ncbi:MAG TPA: hypothetical protein VFI73_13535 [Candidatus Nitrosopolaris sp.]|nr:hypothetical protein [Candidatus Nitrosopolaris sp.]
MDTCVEPEQKINYSTLEDNMGSSMKSLKKSLKRRLPLAPGVWYAFHLDGFYSLLHFIYCRKIKRHNTILTLGKTFHYFDTFKTWHGERSVEIPIVMEMVRKYQGKNILEVGNVLSHHVRFEHDILDKYEMANGVINADVVDFTSEKKYDLIVSISTLEHVGWDEKPRDDTKILLALENMRNLISSRGGTIMITVPLGYNPTLDKLLKEGAIRFSRQHNLLRISKGNDWREASWETVLAAKYNTPLPFANGLLIGIIVIEPTT